MIVHNQYFLIILKLKTLCINVNIQKESDFTQFKNMTPYHWLLKI